MKCPPQTVFSSYFCSKFDWIKGICFLFSPNLNLLIRGGFYFLIIGSTTQCIFVFKSLTSKYPPLAEDPGLWPGLVLFFSIINRSWFLIRWFLLCVFISWNYPTLESGMTRQVYEPSAGKSESNWNASLSKRQLTIKKDQCFYLLWPYRRKKYGFSFLQSVIELAAGITKR